MSSKQRYEIVKARSGKAMADLWRERGYAWGWNREAGGYLTWNDSLRRKGPSWASLFREFQLLEYKGSPWPSARVTTLMDPGPSTLHEMAEVEQERLQAVAAHFRERQESGELIGVEADLAAARDALEKQIRRTEEVVSEPLSKIKRILKVWVHESEQAVRKARGGDEEDPPLPELNEPLTQERLDEYQCASREGLRGVRNDARMLWAMACDANGAEALERSLEERISPHAAPEVIAAATKAAVLHFYEEDVLPHLRSVQQLDRKRVLYEKNLYRILHDEKVMSAEEVQAMLEDERRDRLLNTYTSRSAEPYWKHAYDLYCSDNLDGWEAVFDHMCSEQEDLSLSGKRHSTFGSFSSDRTRYQANNPNIVRR